MGPLFPVDTLKGRSLNSTPISFKGAPPPPNTPDSELEAAPCPNFPGEPSTFVVANEVLDFESPGKPKGEPGPPIPNKLKSLWLIACVL